jgi:hypothetical protein
MPKLIKHANYSDGFDTATYPMTIQQFSYGERLGALTLIYLELSLPLQVALRAAEADLLSISRTKITIRTNGDPNGIRRRSSYRGELSEMRCKSQLQANRSII